MSNCDAVLVQIFMEPSIAVTCMFQPSRIHDLCQLACHNYAWWMYISSDSSMTMYARNEWKEKHVVIVPLQ